MLFPIIWRSQPGTLPINIRLQSICGPLSLYIDRIYTPILDLRLFLTYL